MKITYTRLPLSAFSVQAEQDGASFLVSDEFPGQKIFPTPRFWRSLWNLLKVNEGLFDYFSSEEIFTQVSKKEGKKLYRFCLEGHGDHCRMLAMSSLTIVLDAPVKFVAIESVVSDIGREDTVESGYHNGLVHSVGRLDSNPLFQIAKSKVATRKKSRGLSSSLPLEVMESRGISSCFLRRQPVDGLGAGSFCYGVTLGDGFLFFDSIRTKVISSNGTNNVEQFAILRQQVTSDKSTSSQETVYEATLRRIGHASESAASLGEIAEFFRIVDKHEMSISRFDELLAHPFEAFGLASYNALSKTRLARLPTRNTVLDLFEVMALAAAQLPPAGRFQLYRLAGTMISNFYDFEGLLFSDLVGEKTATNNENVIEGPADAAKVAEDDEKSKAKSKAKDTSTSKANKAKAKAKRKAKKKSEDAGEAPRSERDLHAVGSQVEVDLAALEAPRPKNGLRLVVNDEPERKLKIA